MPRSMSVSFGFHADNVFNVARHVEQQKKRTDQATFIFPGLFFTWVLLFWYECLKTSRSQHVTNDYLLFTAFIGVCLTKDAIESIHRLCTDASGLIRSWQVNIPAIHVTKYPFGHVIVQLEGYGLCTGIPERGSTLKITRLGHAFIHILGVSTDILLFSSHILFNVLALFDKPFSFLCFFGLAFRLDNNDMKIWVECHEIKEIWHTAWDWLNLYVSWCVRRDRMAFSLHSFSHFNVSWRHASRCFRSSICSDHCKSFLRCIYVLFDDTLVKSSGTIERLVPYHSSPALFHEELSFASLVCFLHKCLFHGDEAFLLE